MKLLPDTGTFLWLAAEDPRLSRLARRGFRDPNNEVFLSALSVWEIAIKNRMGRLPLPEPPAKYVRVLRESLGVLPLPFDEEAAAHDRQLPPLHRDPFDRAWCRRRS